MKKKNLKLATATLALLVAGSMSCTAFAGNAGTISFDEQTGTLTFGGKVENKYDYELPEGIRSSDVTSIKFEKGAVLPENFEFFFGCFENVEYIDMTGADASNVVRMTGLFEDCTNLKSVDFGSIDTSNVEWMDRMFIHCANLEDVDFSGIDTSSVEDMWGMFSGCWSLETLDLSGFNTDSLGYCADMFRNCGDLTTIYVGAGWNVDKVTDGYYMFIHCDNLIGQNGTAYDGNYEVNYAHVDGGEANPGYLTAK